ncbi:hypothetical protein [Undibacterium sp.]|uniref:hypothetical protein n=1 Tax=Undibacterium sp. TaxID=1914977 RepID=UPI00272F4BB3|nr:hypothetical protein [Undibacterium sp.]MDP1978494.1 hypothetical protein [Undibacterium sp.]
MNPLVQQVDLQAQLQPQLPLPRALEPWRDWLTLFPPELTEAIGHMLLRLDPLVGRLKFASQRTNDEPVGIGNIVQRGNYDRLLMTEWLFADAEPDEFIRRAASGELLFLGTEPDIRLRSQLCIALFDAGPMQLGEPRLAHVVLFILLSRRAEEAGAQFKWGILQNPGVLYETQGREAIKALLTSKSLRNATTAELDAWDILLKEQDKNACDCWQISGVHTIRIKRATNLFNIRLDLFSSNPDNSLQVLQVLLTQRNNEREISLELPASDVAIRILREPFKRLDGLAHIRNGKNRPSLKQAPRFASKGCWLAVPQLDGGVIIYNVPQSVRAAPGKFRHVRLPSKGSILAASVMGKNLAYIAADGLELSFHGFPSQHFSSKKVVVQRPEMKYFRASIGGTRWLPTYFMESRKNTRSVARVFVQDIDQHLVCWESLIESTNVVGSRKLEPSEPRFKSIASNVIGSDFLAQRLLYSVAENGGTKICRWHAHEDAPLSVATIPHVGQRILFGNEYSWSYATSFEHGLLALQISENEWWIGTSNAHVVKTIPSTLEVVGVTSMLHHGEDDFGLVVLSQDKHSIQFIGQTKQSDLHKSAEAIAKISMDADSGRLAWVLQNTLTIKVRGLKEEALLLNVTTDGVLT